MVLDTILAMLDSCGSSSPLFPPTDLYNETWLLRLVVDWFSRHEVPGHFEYEPEYAESIEDFYRKCRDFNR